MSLNSIQIPELLVSELYRDNLMMPTADKLAAASGGAAGRTAPQQEPAGPRPAAPAPTQQHEPGPTQILQPRQISPPPSLPSDVNTSAAPTSTTPAGAGRPAVDAATGAVIYKFLGGNRRKISILVHSAQNPFLPDDQLAVLTKILEACKMNIGDVAIVNAATAPIAINSLREQLQPATAILFGVQPVDIQLPINFPIFKIQDYGDCTFLCAPPLSELVPPTEESKLLKSKLWVCLKTIFGI